MVESVHLPIELDCVEVAHDVTVNATGVWEIVKVPPPAAV